MLLEGRKVKALERIANELDALTLWFEDIDKNERPQVKWVYDYRDDHDDPTFIKEDGTIDEDELESAKKIISNNLKFKLNKPKDFTHFIQSEYNVNGYNLETISSGLIKLNDVSLDDVNKAAARIYNPNNFILLVMGKKDSCATFLDQFEDVEYYEHTEELR